MPKIIGSNTRSVPTLLRNFGVMATTEVTVVLVEGIIGDYAAYQGVDDCVHLFYSSCCWHERDIPKTCIYNADDELGLPYPDPTSPEYYSPPLLERKENE